MKLGYCLLRTDAGISDAFGSSTLKAFRPVHSSKLHHLFPRLSLSICTADQHLDAQRAALTAAGMERIYEEKEAGGRWKLPYTNSFARSFPAMRSWSST